MIGDLHVLYAILISTLTTIYLSLLRKPFKKITFLPFETGRLLQLVRSWTGAGFVIYKSWKP